MLARLLLLLSLGACSALVLPTAGARSLALSAPRAASPMMAGQSGTGHGKAPPKDKKRRGEVRKAVQAADSAEKVKELLLTPIMEKYLLKMNWKKRISMGVRIKKRAAQFGVEIPEGFASFDVKPRSSKKYLLKPTL